MSALVLFGTSACAGPESERDDAGYANRADVRTFAVDVALRRQLDLDWVLEQLAQAKRLPSAQRLMMPAPPGQPKNWSAYRERFIDARRILAGVDFWRENAQALARAEASWGGAAEIIVGIIGVETLYGRIMGDFRVIDALATLAFDFPAGRSDRSDYFRAELEEFLVFSRREGLSATAVEGSFAGAIGLPQFMPGSINRYAVDFDGDGHIDLQQSPADAIGSVAHFLAEHGWQRDVPTHFAVTPPADLVARAKLLVPDIVPTFSAGEFEAAGARLDEAGHAFKGLLALVMLENGGAPQSFVAGTQNFYVVTRYNRSSYYALAVIELGAAVRRSL